jgi:transposase
MKPEVVHGSLRVEAVRLIRERGVSVAQAARDLEIHENMLRRWAKELSADPVYRSRDRRRPTSLR